MPRSIVTAENTARVLEPATELAITGKTDGRMRNDETRTAAKAPLSPRERQCLELLAHGQSNSEIAGNLGIRLPTVALHLASARRKLGAITREHAIALAISRGMFTL
jgi:DNA-binding CsgD family transcriptional regulator